MEGKVKKTNNIFEAPWIACSDSKDGELVLLKPNPFYGFKPNSTNNE